MVHDEEESLYVDDPHVEPEGMRGPRVVVAVDGSTGSRAALLFAVEDASRRGVPVEAVIAYRVPELWLDYNAIGSSEQERLHAAVRSQSEDRVRAVVDEVARESSAPLPEVWVRAAPGSPSEVLLQESEGADLLVVGSRGHGAFSSVLLGSTGMQCALHATCPVTVVHSPEAKRHRLRLHRERKPEKEHARLG